MEYKFKDNSDEVLLLLKKATTRGLKAIGSTAEKYAKENCPVDTGRLRNSISYESDDRCAIVGTNVEYAPYVELGPSEGKLYAKPVSEKYQNDSEKSSKDRNKKKKRFQPFLKPAVMNHKKEYESILKESLKRA